MKGFKKGIALVAVLAFLITAILPISAFAVDNAQGQRALDFNGFFNRAGNFLRVNTTEVSIQIEGDSTVKLPALWNAQPPAPEWKYVPYDGDDGGLPTDLPSEDDKYETTDPNIESYYWTQNSTVMSTWWAEKSKEVPEGCVLDPEALDPPEQGASYKISMDLQKFADSVRPGKYYVGNLVEQTQGQETRSEVMLWIVNVTAKVPANGWTNYIGWMGQSNSDDAAAKEYKLGTAEGPKLTNTFDQAKAAVESSIEWAYSTTPFPSAAVLPALEPTKDVSSAGTYVNIWDAWDDSTKTGAPIQNWWDNDATGMTVESANIAWSTVGEHDAVSLTLTDAMTKDWTAPGPYYVALKYTVDQTSNNLWYNNDGTAKPVPSDIDSKTLTGVICWKIDVKPAVEVTEVTRADSNSAPNQKTVFTATVDPTDAAAGTWTVNGPQTGSGDSVSAGPNVTSTFKPETTAADPTKVTLTIPADAAQDAVYTVTYTVGNSSKSATLTIGAKLPAGTVQIVDKDGVAVTSVSAAANSPVVLTAQTTNAAGEPVTATGGTWNLVGTGDPAPTAPTLANNKAATQTISFPQTGTYTATYTPTTGSPASVTINVTMGKLLIVPSDSKVAVGSELKLTATPDTTDPTTAPPLIPPAGSVYQWTVTVDSGEAVTLTTQNAPSYGITIGGANNSELTFAPENATVDGVATNGASIKFDVVLKASSAANAASLTDSAPQATVQVTNANVYVVATAAGTGSSAAEPQTYAGISQTAATTVTLEASNFGSDSAASGAWSVQGPAGSTVKLSDMTASASNPLTLAPNASVPAGTYTFTFTSDEGATDSIDVEIKAPTVTVEPAENTVLAGGSVSGLQAGFKLDDTLIPFASDAGKWTVTAASGTATGITFSAGTEATTDVATTSRTAAGSYTLTYTLGTGTSAPKGTAALTVTAAPKPGTLAAFAQSDDNEVIKNGTDSITLQAVMSNGTVTGNTPNGSAPTDAVWTLPETTTWAYWGVTGTPNSSNQMPGATLTLTPPVANNPLAVNQDYTFTCTSRGETSTVTVRVLSPATLAIDPAVVTIPLGLESKATLAYTPAGETETASLESEGRTVTWTVTGAKNAQGADITMPAITAFTEDETSAADAQELTLAPKAASVTPATYTLTATTDDGTQASVTVVVTTGELTITPNPQTVNQGRTASLTAMVNGQPVSDDALIGLTPWSITAAPTGTTTAAALGQLVPGNVLDAAELALAPVTAPQGNYTVQFELGNADSLRATATVTVAAPLAAGTLYIDPDQAKLTPEENPQQIVTPMIASGNINIPASQTSTGEWTLPENGPQDWSQWNPSYKTDSAQRGQIILNPTAAITDGDYTFTYKLPATTEFPEGQEAQCTITVALGNEPVADATFTADNSAKVTEPTESEPAWGVTVPETGTTKITPNPLNGTWTPATLPAGITAAADGTLSVDPAALGDETATLTYTYGPAGATKTATVVIGKESTTPPAPTEYALTIEPANSGVTTNPADTSALTAGTRVTLTTAADAVLSASAGTLQATNATTWTLTMPASNVTVTVTTLETGEVAVVQPAQAPVTTISESEAQGGNTVGIRSTMSYNRQTQQFNALLYLPAVKGSADAEPTIALDTSKGQTGQIVDANGNPLEVTWTYANGMWTAEPSLVMLINFDPTKPIDIVVTTEGDYTFKDTNSNAVDVDTGDEEAMVKYAPAMIPPAISFS